MIITNRYDSLVTKQKMVDIGHTAAYFSETPPSDAPDGSDPVLNIKQLINGRVNFKVIYNMLNATNKMTPSISIRSSSQNQDTGSYLFTYNNTVRGIYASTSSTGGTLKSEMVKAPTVMNNLSTSSSTPYILTTQYGPATTVLKDRDGMMYYIIPAYSTTSTTGYLGCGVLSSSWNYPTSDPSLKWCIGNVLSLNKSYNYIIAHSPDPDVNSTYWQYYNSGAFYTTGTFGYTSHKNNIRNDRLKSYFYSIPNGFLNYSRQFWGGSWSSLPQCSMFYRTNGSTFNVHLVPRSIDVTQTKAFDVYDHVAYFDLSTLSQYSITPGSSLVLYPGDFKLSTQIVGDIDSLSGLTADNKNHYNRNQINLRYNASYGKILYILGAPSVTLNLAVNVPKYYSSSYTTAGWFMQTGGTAAAASLRTTSLSTGYNYAVEVWIENASATKYKLYRYSKTNGAFGSVTAELNAITT